MWGGGLPPEGVTYFNIFCLILTTLVSRQIAENLVEIHLYLPEISPIFECGERGCPKKG